MNIFRKTLFARYTVLASFALLWLVLVASLSWSALPLLVFAWGIWREDWRTHIWLCFVLLFYFLVIINQLAQTPASWTGWLECALIALLFTSAMFYCRWVKMATLAEEGTL